MAVNSDSTNKLYPVNDTSVKFFSSLTRRQAKGLDNFTYNDQLTNITNFPGAICFVSDSDGNSIFLNKLLFGDGATAGSVSGGGSGSGSGGGGGITEVTLDMIPVVIKDGVTLKTLANYFSNDGTVITESLQIISENQQGDFVQYILINDQGISIGGSPVITQTQLNTELSTVQGNINTAEQNAKDYADSLVTSVYKVRGSVYNYSDLNNKNPDTGDVYNVINANGNIPAGTNYVWNGVSWDALGGIVDLGAYATTTALNTKCNEVLNEAKNYTDTKVEGVTSSINTLQTNLTTLTGQVSSISTSVSNLSTTVSTNTTNIEQNTTNITNISTQLTWQ